jgi:hypothetical protein
VIPFGGAGGWPMLPPDVLSRPFPTRLNVEVPVVPSEKQGTLRNWNNMEQEVNRRNDYSLSVSCSSSFRFLVFVRLRITSDTDV